MKPLLAIACVVLAFGSMTACEKQKPQIQKAADALKEAGSKTGEAFKEAGAKTGEAFKEAGRKTGEAAEDGAGKIREAIHEATRPPEPATPPAPAALDCVVKNIDGKDVNLADYKGKVVLIVNVASKCGYTPQYTGLEKLYTSRKDQGLVILGFPSNDFGKQEPGTEADIKAFCSDTYKVDFPMFAKVDVKGDDACDLYKRLAAATPPPGEDKSKSLGAPKWNFTKYLIDRKGVVVAKFDSAVAPDDAKLTGAIDAAIAAK